MYFYQAHYSDGTFGELRMSREDAMADLTEAGYDVSLLVEKKSGLWYTENHDPFFGISLTRI